MKNRVLPLLCAFVFALAAAFSANAAHTGVAATPDTEKRDVLRLLEIMNGDENGDLHLDAPVTRAEFVKMAVCASPMKDNVAKASAFSLFPDVTHTHWARGYIAAAIDMGLVNGYLDGTFRPENTVTLEEAVTVSLKLLGYTAADLPGTYPDAQIAKYRDLDLDTGITAAVGAPLVRFDCLKLIYNLLCTPAKSGARYCTTLGVPADTDDTVDYLALLAGKMTGPFLNLGNSYRDTVPFASAYDVTVYRDGRQTSTAAIADYDVYYYNETLRTVWCYTDKAFGKITQILPNRETPASLLLDGRSFALAPEAAKAVSTAGSFRKDDTVMLCLDKDGRAAAVTTATLALIEKFTPDGESVLDNINKTLDDPVVVTDPANVQSLVPFPLEKATVTLDGERLSPEDLRDGDVLYCSALAESILVCRDRASGVLLAVTPGRENPASVTVGGKTYPLATDEVKKKLSYLGDVPDQSLVTLLLGKDGAVVDIRKADISVIGDGEEQVSFAEVVAATLKGPYIAAEEGKLLADTAVDADTAVFYRKNAVVSLAAVKPYTVYYYSSVLNTVWLYDDTASGTVDAVLPSAAAPQSVTLSGKSYALETGDARFAFSSLGAFRTGDRVTLLLGKDGAAAGAVKAGTTDTRPAFGVVLAAGKSRFTDAEGRAYTADSLTVYTVTGDTFTYEADGSRYAFGDAVRVDVTSSGAYVAGLSAPRTVSQIVELNEALAAGNFAPDCAVMDTVPRASACTTVTPSRLAGASLRPSDVKYFALDENGALLTLILDDYTGDLVTYGFITSAEKTAAGFAVKYLTDDNEQTYYAASNAFSVREGAAWFVISGGTVTYMKNLTSSFTVRDLTSTTVTDENNVRHTLADNVRVYRRVNGNLTVCDIDDIRTGSYTVNAYADGDDEAGGRVRVLVAY